MNFVTVSPRTLGNPIHINLELVTHIEDGLASPKPVVLHFCGGTRIKLKGELAEEFRKLLQNGKLWR